MNSLIFLYRLVTLGWFLDASVCDWIAEKLCRGSFYKSSPLTKPHSRAVLLPTVFPDSFQSLVWLIRPLSCSNCRQQSPLSHTLIFQEKPGRRLFWFWKSTTTISDIINTCENLPLAVNVTVVTSVSRLFSNYQVRCYQLVVWKG